MMDDIGGAITGRRDMLAQRGDTIMSRLSAFNSPLLLGFDHFEQILDRVSKAGGDGYPPYNIEQTGEHALLISIAVAGFSLGDLSVTTEDNQLIVCGRQTDDDRDRVYLHRGIAARQFQRSFVLAEGIEIKGARIDNGLLHIDLERHLPEPEVMMEVEVLEVKRSRLKELGINYPNQLTFTADAATAEDLKHLNASKWKVNPIGVGFNLKKELSDANILANPRIRARNHEKARIHIGEVTSRCAQVL